MNRLKILRKEKGETQDQVAEVAGVSKRSYIYWENGERQIKPDKAQALADHFGVPVGYLLGYESDNQLIHSLTEKISKMSGEEASAFAFTDEGELLAELMYEAEKRKEQRRDKKFRAFVKFLKENIIILSDEEIENFFNMLMVSSLNSGAKKELYSKIADEDFNKAVDFLESIGYKMFFDKSFLD
ncbi:TPA: helix-turn-helix transcriptional regulator [Streptococcus suis 2524]|uniref:helix-turn-helix domain-containing protein n=1 Tax=Streptococcus suis TaxID=1307 RepID=UPI0004077D92|nr:helix-turn-helix transcriptional regulator [Streptococcus suis]RRR30971.1 XRE family transcriptional regulator [Streptococcus suis]RRR38019.1 XRE family transcriptional regulator [Streptococcus suis]RRR53273.1 XRE family transcriptional regulator [Streptococcus suis]RRR58490.1 XRE family transcriptional regulator [Streptococcus suis]HEM3217792.1 helix-turn-helix transcriptional regulator [Streptococcus suis 2524]